jgi:hypothetical protein
MAYWRISYGEESEESQYYRFCNYYSDESFQKFVKRLCSKLSLEENNVVPFKYHVVSLDGYFTITVNDDEDYIILVDNMLNSESSKKCNQGYELILPCSPNY